MTAKEREEGAVLAAGLKRKLRRWARAMIATGFSAEETRAMFAGLGGRLPPVTFRLMTLWLEELLGDGAVSGRVSSN